MFCLSGRLLLVFFHFVTAWLFVFCSMCHINSGQLTEDSSGLLFKFCYIFLYGRAISTSFPARVSKHSGGTVHQ